MRYKGSIDLSKLKGAQILNVKMPDGAMRACVVIPAAFNDMVRDGRVTPYLNFTAWEANQKFVEACRDRHRDKASYIPPCHTIDLSFGQEFRAQAEESARRRIVAERPDLSPDDLRKEITKSTRIQLGTLTELPYQGAGIAPSTDVVAEASSGEVTPLPEDDLPF